MVKSLLHNYGLHYLTRAGIWCFKKLLFMTENPKLEEKLVSVPFHELSEVRGSCFGHTPQSAQHADVCPDLCFLD